MFGVLNVYQKNRSCGQLSWESERNRYVVMRRILPAAEGLEEKLTVECPSPVYAQIRSVIGNQVETVCKKVGR